MRSAPCVRNNKQPTKGLRRACSLPNEAAASRGASAPFSCSKPVGPGHSDHGQRMAWVGPRGWGLRAPAWVLAWPLRDRDGLLAAPWRRPFRPGPWLPASLTPAPRTGSHCVQVANAFSPTLLRGLERGWDSGGGSRGPRAPPPQLSPPPPRGPGSAPPLPGVLCYRYWWVPGSPTQKLCSLYNRSSSSNKQFALPKSDRIIRPAILPQSQPLLQDPGLHALPIPLWQNWAPFSPLAQEYGTKLFLWSVLWAGSACTAVKTVRRNSEDTNTCADWGSLKSGVTRDSASLWRRHSRVWRTLLPSLEGIQQDNPGSPPKRSLALEGVSGLDISLFNLFWPDGFFNQECVNSFQNVCMRDESHSLLRFFNHLSFKKKKSL